MALGVLLSSKLPTHKGNGIGPTSHLMVRVYDFDLCHNISIRTNQKIIHLERHDLSAGIQKNPAHMEKSTSLMQRAFTDHRSAINEVHELSDAWQQVKDDNISGTCKV